MLGLSVRQSKVTAFVPYISSHKEVSSESISRWFNTDLSNVGIDTSVFSAHSTRSASAFYQLLELTLECFLLLISICILCLLVYNNNHVISRMENIANITGASASFATSVIDCHDYSS
ncbi:endonuclease-reverse transcriptase [Plakobranchus ocellatus]|uniref:Endonuclease-reverse transcriptase n=1 Tax=Plakobranchus ocellatus TaxID=259542 RepID=A0AAV3YI59_9GAST|nr:endonuclease-reverse transcriptase [Plakobranchus ocellatus]